MRAVDTNIIVRALANDDPIQTPIARRVTAEGVFASITVILEAEWVLRFSYKWRPVAVVDALTELLDTGRLTIAEPEKLRFALARHRAGVDFADMLHIALSADHPPFATFDRALDDPSLDGGRIELLR